MKKCIVINGISGSGKDTFIKIFSSLSKHNTYNISSVDLVKEIAEKYADWNNIKNQKNRNFLADLKQLLIDYNNIPFKYCKNYYDKIEDGIIFMHIREPEEIDKIKKSIPPE